MKCKVLFINFVLQSTFAYARIITIIKELVSMNPIFKPKQNAVVRWFTPCQIIWISLCCAISLIQPVKAQTIDKVKLDQFFDQLAAKNKAMGSLVMVKKGQLLYSRSIGYSQIDSLHQQPLTTQTKFRIGSVTKMFTATLIFQLIEEGKLKLTDQLSQFFPQIPNANQITIEQILAHRSGIHEMSEDQDFRALRFKTVAKAELIAMIAKRPLDFEPGTKYAYSNSGYMVLAHIIEKVSGKSYQEMLSKKITTKIGLKDTYLGTGNSNVDHNESFSYKYSRKWELQPETNMSILFGAGAMIATPIDQAQFITALFTGKLLTQKSLDQMMKLDLGMEKFTYNGKTFYGHTGGVDGFGSWLVYSPEEQFTLSYATNGKVYPVEDLINTVFNIYYNPAFTLPSFETLALSKETLDSYVGIYGITGAPIKFTVSREGSTLFVQLPGQSALPLVPTATDKFKVESAPIAFEFDVAKKQMTIKRNGGERVLTKEN